MGGDINGYTLGDFMNIYFDVLINEQGGEEEEEEEEEEEDYYYHQLNSILMKFSQLFNPAMGKMVVVVVAVVMVGWSMIKI